MWKRKDLKNRAKKVIKKNYWTIVIACFIIAICTGEFGLTSATFERNYETSDITERVTEANTKLKEVIFGIFKNKDDTNLVNRYSNRIEDSINSTINSTIKSQKYAFKIVDAVRLYIENHKQESIILFVAGCTAFLFIIFVADPLLVGERRFFLHTKASKKTKVGVLATVFHKDQWLNIAKIMFIRNIYTFLWYFTIIGGMIKTYEYQMIPYILAENPQINKKEAFKLSKQMMKGNKWKSFVLDLSFILWYILSFITLGLVGVFYVNPYTTATRTELYLYLKKEGIKKKYEFYEELLNKKIEDKEELKRA